MSLPEENQVVRSVKAIAEVNLQSNLVARGRSDAALLLHSQDLETPQSLHQLRQRAEAGDAEAQVELGGIYYHGLRGERPNFLEAISWYCKAADQGSARAQYAMGRAYTDGVVGLPPDRREAIKWYRRAAMQRDKEAILALGEIFEPGSIARQLAVERPVYWEHLLTEKLLRSKMSDLQNRYGALDYELLAGPEVHFNGLEYAKYLQEQFDAFSERIPELKRCTEQDIKSSWGKPGMPGDPIEILNAVNRLGRLCEGFVEWERKTLLAEPPKALKRLRESLRGSAAGILDEIARIPDDIANAVQKAQKGTGTTKHTINLVFKGPRQMENVLAELADARGNIGGLV